jgi:hypothetical protein
MRLVRILNDDDVNVPACLVDAYEDYSCFGEVCFFEGFKMKQSSD